MRINFICMGQKMPTWVQQGYQEYAKRLPSQCELNLIEIPLTRRGKNADIPRIQQDEGKRMLAQVSHDSFVLALDERGKTWDTAQLSQQLNNWMQNHTQVALLVGGPEGLASECLQKAQQKWSLSALTLPHPLVRVVVAEQIYRAWTLLNNHPYHRA
jgi:23S rRNA (pseudouridine1915-N3)-methyltransferase